jgi:putative endonuclease
MNQDQYFIYIITNKHNTVLYTGSTNDLRRKIEEHKSGQGGAFSSKYHCNKLVYYEIADDVITARAREKQIKGGSRQKKIDLVTKMNPNWEDLSDHLFY